MKWSEMLKREWEIRPCWSGTDCWCRRICTISGAKVVDGARISQDIASYFTALHNTSLRRSRLNYKKFENIDFYDDDGKLITKNLMNKKWKVAKCGVPGGNCPCRVIIAKGGYWVIDAGSLNKRQAKYLAKLHNHFLKEKK